MLMERFLQFSCSVVQILSWSTEFKWAAKSCKAIVSLKHDFRQYKEDHLFEGIECCSPTKVYQIHVFITVDISRSYQCW